MVLLADGTTCHYNRRSYKTRTTWQLIEVDDTPATDLLCRFSEAADFIDNALCGNQHRTSRVLVHCMTGISRSSTIVIAYLMARAHVPLGVALRAVKACRPVASPNPGFVEQLARFERTLPGLALSGDTATPAQQHS